MIGCNFNTRYGTCEASVLKVDKPIYFTIIIMHVFLVSCHTLFTFSIVFPNVHNIHKDDLKHTVPRRVNDVRLGNGVVILKRNKER